MRAQKFKIYTLGCKVNQYDSGALARRLLDRGMKNAGKNAQLAIINTCAVTKTAISKDRRMIAKAKRENPKAKIVVMGCWPQTYSEEALKSEVDLICSVDDIDKIIKLIPNSKFQTPNQFFKIKSQSLNLDRSRYFIKVQDGCEQHCSYCIIPYTRGKLKSRGVEEIINEVKNAVREGYREIVVSGIHLGLYGKDKKDRGIQRLKNLKIKRLNLAHLLRELIKIKSLGRIRLSSIEVTEISDELIKLIKTGKICPHLHIPLQSGSDKILKRMNRPYSVKFFKNVINKLRKAIQDIALTTDVIVGFPGETDEDFKKTMGFIKDINFSKLHVFPFSAHEKTPAAKMAEKIKEDIILKRAKILRELSQKLEKNYQKRFKNKKLEVVVAPKIGPNIWQGRTEYSFNIQFRKNQIISPRGKIKVGKIVEVGLLLF